MKPSLSTKILSIDVDGHPHDGVSLFGLIRPTLENPSFITVDPVMSFYRPVLSPEGEVRGVVVVSVTDNSLSVELADVSAVISRIADGLSAENALSADNNTDNTAVFKCLSASMGDSASVFIPDFNLAAALMGWGSELYKADHGPIPDDARWITVHPNGDGSKGVPILVQPAKDNSGTFHVIGGAGGKLNYLKLRGVKSEGEYQKDAGERHAAKKAAKKQQTAEDKAAGIHEAKNIARQAINEQRTAARDDFVKSVAEAMGWGPDELEFKADKLSPEAAKKGEAEHISK